MANIIVEHISDYMLSLPTSIDVESVALVRNSDGTMGTKKPGEGGTEMPFLVVDVLPETPQYNIIYYVVNSEGLVISTHYFKEAGPVYPQDGYWVHKDTDVKTFFGADADFITNGVMSQPSWIRDSKEIFLCSGITKLEESDYEGSLSNANVFQWDMSGEGDLFNSVLEVLNFGNASIESFEYRIINSYNLNSGESKFHKLVLNDKVKTLGRGIIESVYTVNTLSKPKTTIEIHSTDIQIQEDPAWVPLVHILVNENYTGTLAHLDILCKPGQKVYLDNLLEPSSGDSFIQGIPYTVIESL